MNIVPAIEEQTVEGFKNTLNKVSEFSDRLHVDFNDGTFENVTTLLPSDLEKLITPLAGKIIFEAHLMVQQPHLYIPKLLETGFKKLIIQFEINDNLRDVFEQLNLHEIDLGLAVAPETEIADVEPLIEFVKTITIMTVNPGRQGQQFLPENLTKVKLLRDDHFSGEIEIDGGVNSANIVKFNDFGVDTAVVGSFIVNTEEPSEMYDRLIRLTN